MSRAISQTVSRRSLVCAALVVLAAAVHVRAADPHVVVRIYDTANIAADVRAAAIREAAAIIDHAGIAIVWHDCTRGDDVAACGKSPGNWNLIVRIVPTFIPGSPARAAVRALQGVADGGSPLGVAVFDPGAHADAMATIFDEQVQTVAGRTNVDRSELLGRALAHELGHLLLRVTGHSRTGLMRAVWTDMELGQNRHDDWVFAEPDRHRLQLNLSRP
jgi:hypothetical protein